MTRRSVGAAPGASFSRNEEGDVLFSFVLDAANVIGPRPATAADQEAHPEAWRLFCAREGVGPLDRDARDGDGGSLPASPETIEKPDGRRRRKVTNEPADDHPAGL